MRILREKGVRTINDIVNLITKKSKGKRLIVFVCGFGGAGKTTFCHHLATILTLPTIIFETDWYAKYATKERRQRISSALASKDKSLIEKEENPKNWYDWTALIADLNSLKETGRLQIHNGWSQQTGEKDLSINLELPTNGDSVIICDGIYLLHDEVKLAADLTFLLNTSVDLCLERSTARDSHRSPKEYLDYKAALVEKYDKPYFRQHSKNAHSIVSAQLV